VTTQGRVIATCAALFALGACSRLPDRVASVEQARDSLTALEREPLAGRVAAREIAAGREALAEADDAYEERAPLPLIEHQAYIAQRYADISNELVAEARAREEVESGEAQRSRIIAEARTREAEAAAREAEAATRELEVQARVAEEQSRAAEAADARSREAQERSEQLEQELEELEARDTDRGLVLTLGDVLFDTGAATLKPGAATTIDRLAQFMRDYPERAVRIEGHTDAAGSDETNQSLSERRAQAVREALVGRGLDAARIATLGFGEARPIADNDTPGGRQQNRRVEIVVSDAQGVFADDGRRTLL
jgi:outer membrane protein OmpA-like peptidoglycan-associated protein